MSFPFPFMIPRPSYNSAVISYNASYTNTSNLSTYTFTGVSYGTAATDRILLLTPEASGANSGLTINSVTVDGNAATLVVKTNSNETCVSIWAIALPTGTSGTVVVTYSGTSERSTLGTFSLTGTNGVLSAFNTNLNNVSATSIGTTVNIPVGGAVLAAAARSNSTPVSTASWTGATLAYSINPEGFNSNTAATIGTAAAPVSAQAISALLSSGAPATLASIVVASFN